MNCEEVRELLGAYVLDAVSDDERAEIETHLEACGLHGEVGSLRATTLGLAASVPPREPDPSLLPRVMQAALAGSRSNTAYEPRESQPDGHRWRRRLRTGYAMAAAFALIAMALLAWNLTLQFGGESSEPQAAAAEERFVHSYSKGDGDWLRIETTLGAPGVAASFGGLEPLLEGRYQFWAIRDERWITIGVFRTTPEGRWSGDFAFTFHSGDLIAVTVEKASGSERPTSDPIMRTRL